MWLCAGRRPGQTKAPRGVRSAFGLFAISPRVGHILRVLKLHTSDHSLVSVLFEALTRQKYVTRLSRPVTVVDVPVTDWSETSVPNVELVDTWTRYEVAPATAFQESVTSLGTLRAPFMGDARMGAASPGGGGGGPNSE